MTSRRHFLLGLGATALTPLALRALPSTELLEMTATDGAPLRGVGVQLYMLRDAMRTDPEGTLKRIAETGFSEIEWWGRWGRTPQQLRATLDAHGLRSPSAHFGLDDLLPDRLPAVLDAAEVMGQRTVIVASTTKAQNGTLEAWQRTAAALTTAGRTAAARGIRAGYHNHDYEFQRFGDRTLLEILLAETDPTVVDLELDCFWAYKAGQDPIAFLTRYRDRITMLHVKDSTAAPEYAQRDVGAGVIDWRTLLRTALAGRVAHLYVEHDAPADAWTTARTGRTYLTSLGY